MKSSSISKPMWSGQDITGDLIKVLKIQQEVENVQMEKARPWADLYTVLYKYKSMQKHKH